MTLRIIASSKSFTTVFLWFHQPISIIFRVISHMTFMADHLKKLVLWVKVTLGLIDTHEQKLCFCWFRFVSIYIFLQSMIITFSRQLSVMVCIVHLFFFFALPEVSRDYMVWIRVAVKCKMHVNYAFLILFIILLNTNPI